MDNTTDEDTNGSSFEFVEKLTDSSETDEKVFEVINKTSSESSSKSSDSGDDSNETTSKVNPEKCEQSDDLKSKEKINEDPEWMDILGSNQLLKKVIKEGQDNNKPQRMDICVVNYECKVDDKIVEKAEKKEIQLGDVELTQGFDLVLPLMNEGEIAQVKVGPRFGYGSIGFLPNVPPDSTLFYEIELLSFDEEPQIDTMSVQTRSEIGRRKKDRGNWWFLRGEYILALQCYKRALEYLDYTESDNLESEKCDADELIEDRIRVYNNLGTVYMKQENYVDALSVSETVIKLDPDNIKAIYRIGKIHSVRNDLAEALKWFNKALKLDPSNSTIPNEIQKCRTMLGKQTLQERNLYKRMFHKPLTDSPPASRLSRNEYYVKMTLIVVGVVVLAFSIYYAGYNYVV